MSASQDDPSFDAVLSQFTVNERTFYAALDDGGQPPELRTVAQSYQQIEDDLKWAAQLEVLAKDDDADALERLPTPWRDQYTEWRKVREQWLSTLTAGSVVSQNTPRPPAFLSDESAGFAPKLTGRVFGSRHVNPLETVILVSGSVLALTIVSSIWAARQWFRAKNERRTSASVARLLDTIAKTIAQGTPKKIEAVKPIALAAIEAALRSNLPDRLEIGTRPGLKIVVGGSADQPESDPKRQGQERPKSGQQGSADEVEP